MTAAAVVAIPESPFTGAPRSRLMHYLRDLHEVWQDAYLSDSKPAASRRCQDCTRRRIPVARRWREGQKGQPWAPGGDWRDDSRDEQYRNDAGRQGSSYVEVRKRDGRAVYCGVVRCGLVHECPDCSATIKAERARQVEAVKEWHVGNFGEDSAVMVTLTVRHGLGDDLKRIAVGVAAAWKVLQQSPAWKRDQSERGRVGFIRALEVTDGANGWHPHLHNLMLYRVPPDAGRGDNHRVSSVTGACRDCGRTWPKEGEPCDRFAHQVFTMWAAAVAAKLGDEHAPLEFDPNRAGNHRVGVVVTRARDAGYLAKLGLEISAPNSKRAHGTNRTPLDILAAFAATGDTREADRYRAYVDGTKGLHQLSWSRGLKAAAGVTDMDDQAIVDGQARPEDEIVTRLSWSEFESLKRAPGALTTVLELAELHGAIGANDFVRLTLKRITAHDTRRRTLTKAAA